MIKNKHSLLASYLTHQTLFGITKGFFCIENIKQGTLWQKLQHKENKKDDIKRDLIIKRALDNK